MNPTILAALQARDVAACEAALAYKQRINANVKLDLANAGISEAVRSVLREHFPAANLGSRSLVVEVENLTLSVLFKEQHHDGVDFAPVWEVELSEQGDGWSNRWTRIGVDPVEAVHRALGVLDIGRSEAVRSALGLAPPNAGPPFCIHCPGEGVHKMSCTASKNGYVGPHEPCRVPLSTLSAKYDARVTIPVQEVK